MPTTNTSRMYICPGEEHPISRSVHLARLASFYPKCRDCALRCETGALGPSQRKRIQETEDRVARESLMADDGARGVHLNEIDRRWAAQAASAFASILWEQSPLVAAIPRNPRVVQSNERLPRQPARPSVVLGYDDRPASPDLVRGVLAALRRSGCQIIDLGMLTRSQFALAAHHLETTGGLYVTGAGKGPAWTGIDFVAGDAQPVSRFHITLEQAGHAESIAGDESVWALRRGTPTLDAIEQRMRQPVIRHTRHAGSTRSFRIQRIYESHLEKHFRPVPSMRIVVGTASNLLPPILDQVFAKIGTPWIPVKLPRRDRTGVGGSQEDRKRLAASIRSANAVGGLIIEEDGLRCTLLDDCGQPVAEEKLLLALLRTIADESPDRPIIVPSNLKLATRNSIERLGITVVDTARHSMSAFASLMRRHHASYAMDPAGRHWFRDEFPTSDAILLLSRIVKLIAQGDQLLMHSPA